MSTTTYYTRFVKPEPADGPAPVYGVLAMRANGRLECLSRHATEAEAIRAAVDARLAHSPPGTTADTVSQSDLAFHALREYVPGDDLRHVRGNRLSGFQSSPGLSAGCDDRTGPDQAGQDQVSILTRPFGRV